MGYHRGRREGKGGHENSLGSGGDSGLDPLLQLLAFQSSTELLLASALFLYMLCSDYAVVFPS